ncbi:MAG: two-component system, OmpR family, sensor kinase [Chloroflexota bacterium]|nr:two-component system, OmpR family, sensor kinase [Chloroflexota bacterium]
MVHRLSARIALAFAAVAVITLVAVGATLFVALRSLHAEATTSALAQTTQPLVFQFRAAVLASDLRQVLADLREAVVADGVSVELLMADGRVTDLGAAGVTIARFPIEPTAGRGHVDTGSIEGPDGRPYLFAATTLRGPNAAGPRAIVLFVPDTSGAEALRDLTRTLPAVVVLVLLAGAPIAYVLARSVTGPLRRLAAASADLPSGDPQPLPLEGPTEVRDLTERFNAMAAELTETRRRESRLLADLRHDLRTPLTVIGGFAAALADGTAVGQDAATAARAIAEEAARLERLVAELEALERLRDGAAGLRPERLEADALIDETVARFAPTAAAAGIELTAVRDESASGHELSFAADRLAVERILGNLVANAMAASGGPGGHVWLAARSVATAGPAGPAGVPSVVLSVTDDGPGFPPGDVERAFQRFYRGDPSRSGSGTGLGLAIVRELARAHGGEAVAENVAPRGARLSVILPQTPRPPGA